MTRLPLRLLHLDDSTKDAEQIHAVLARDGLDCDVTRAAGRADFEAALAAPEPFDVILSDFHPRGFDGLAALALAQAARPDVPFLFVTDAHGEDLAVASLKGGATDYVLKDRLDRLPSALRRAVREARDRRELAAARDALEGWQRRSAAILNTVYDAVLVFDAHGIVHYANPAVTRLFGYTPAELVGWPAADLLAEPGVRRYVETGQAAALGAGRGVAGRRKDGTVCTLDLAVSAMRREDGGDTVAVFRDVTEQTRLADRLNRALAGTIEAVALALEKRDPYTAGHQQRVAEIGVALAEELGVPAARLEGIRFGALLHDLGKIAVPSEILNRPGRLTPAEFALIRTHPEVGHDIIKGIEFPWPVGDVILHHHERLDGSGYPHGLKGDAITLEARIVAVADVFESMTSHRPYRPALGVAAAMTELTGRRGTLYDSATVDACGRLFRGTDRLARLFKP